MPDTLTLHDRLRSTFRWIGDRRDSTRYADVSGWWRDPDVLTSIGGGLADLHPGSAPTVVMGVQSRGTLLGALVARHLGIGLVEVRKDPTPSADSDRWWEASTGPDYRDRNLRLGLRRVHLRSGDRVLFVDEWVATGAQAEACRRIVASSGASWLGASVIVDGLDRPALRRELGLRSLLHIRELD